MAETSAAPAKAKKATKAKKAASHPKYAEMIVEAITKDPSRGGSSRQYIKKFVSQNYNVGNNADAQIKLALRRLVTSGDLRHTRGVGASGSFKLVKADEAKKPAKAATKTKKVVKPKKAPKPKKVLKTAEKTKKAAAAAAAAKKVKKVTKKAPTTKPKRSPVKKAKPPKAKAKITKKAVKPRGKPAKKGGAKSAKKK